MEDFVFLAGLAGLAFLFGPWIWLFLQRGRIERLERRVTELDHELLSKTNALGKLVADLRQHPAAAPAPVSTPKPEQAPLAPSEVEGRIVVAPPPAEAAHEVRAPAAPVAPAVAVAEPALPPLAPLEPPPAPKPPPPPKAPLEERIAYWFTRVGAGAFLLGIAYFFKYAVDNDWIGPWGRVAIGAITGAVALAIAEGLWRRAQVAYTRVVEGVGLSILMGSAFASVSLYHLVPPMAAFAAIAVIALLGGALASHHKSEPVLMLALLGALLAPVFLSTGQDNPLGLFGYLLLVGGVANWAALRERFTFTPALAIAGTVVLFLGWYTKFFDPNLSGYVALPYHDLRERAVPLLAVAGFCAEWLALAWGARQRKHEAMRPLWLALAGLVFAHGGLAALLFDQPMALGAAFVGLAAVSTTVLRGEGRQELLALPLAVSFVILAAVGRDLGNAAGLPVLALLGVWASVYAAAFLRGRVGTGQPLPVKSASLAASCVAAVGVLGAWFLFGPHPLGFAALLAVLSIPLLALAVLAAAPVLAAVGAVASFTGLASVAQAQTDPKLLFCVGGWALIYFAAGAWDLLRRQQPPTPLRLAVVSGAGLGFVGLVIQQTTDAESLLRSALLGTVGVLDLALGMLLLRAQAKRSAASALLAQALGLFFAAVALLLSGASITIAWAAMAAICAVLASRAKDRTWAMGSLALFAVTVYRVLDRDWQVPEHAHSLFLSSLGKAGQLAPPFLINPRAYALVAVVIALGVAGWQLAKVQETTFRRGAGVLVSSAHVVGLALVLSEAYWLYVKLPVPPTPPFDPGVWSAFGSQVASAQAAQANGVAVLMTILMGVYSLALLGAGFGLREPLHRYLGLSLFAITIGKLAFHDVWDLPRIYQISTLVGVGGMLLLGSFLYANRRSAAAAAAAKSGTAALLLLGLLAASGLARAEPPPSEFVSVGSVNGVTAPGLYHLVVGPELWRASQRDLDDVRLSSASEGELPFFVRPPVAKRQAIPARAAQLLDPVKLPDGSVQATFKLDGAAFQHQGIQLSVQGNDFLRTVRVEASSDGKGYGVLAEGPLVYRISANGANREQLTVRYPASEASYLRVTLLPRGDGQEVALTGGSLLPVNPLGAEEGGAPEQWLPAAVSASTRDQPRHQSRYELHVGKPGVPLTTLRLSVDSPAFERRATVLALGDGQQWQTVGGGVLFRADDGHGHRSENTELGIDTRLGQLRVDVEDGDDAPLRISAASARALDREIVFRSTSGGPVQLYAGDAKASLPQYDLRSVVERMEAASLLPATLDLLHPNPGYQSKAAPVVAPPWTDQHKVPLAIGLGVFLAALAGWTILMLRKGGGETTG